MASKTEIAPKQNPLVAMLETKADSLERMLPSGMSIERFKNSVLSSVSTSPQLMEAFKSNPQSFYLAVHRAAAMGLEPGDTFGHYYLLPFKNGQTSKIDTVGIVGYKGMLELARRHPQVAKINAHVVYEGEEFSYDRGTDEIAHPFSWDTDRHDNKIIGAYCTAVLVHPITQARETVVHLMARKEMEEIRKRSPGGKKKDGPWSTDFPAMCRKSVIRQAMNRGVIPMAAELIQLVAREEDPEQLKPVQAAVVEDESFSDVDYNEVPDLPTEDREEDAARKAEANA